MLYATNHTTSLDRYVFIPHQTIYQVDLSDKNQKIMPLRQFDGLVCDQTELLESNDEENEECSFYKDEKFDADYKKKHDDNEPEHATLLFNAHNPEYIIGKKQNAHRIVIYDSRSLNALKTIEGSSHLTLMYFDPYDLCCMVIGSGHCEIIDMDYLRAEPKREKYGDIWNPWFTNPAELGRRWTNSTCWGLVAGSNGTFPYLCATYKKKEEQEEVPWGGGLVGIKPGGPGWLGLYDVYTGTQEDTLFLARSYNKDLYVTNDVGNLIFSLNPHEKGGRLYRICDFEIGLLPLLLLMYLDQDPAQIKDDRIQQLLLLMEHQLQENIKSAFLNHSGA